MVMGNWKFTEEDLTLFEKIRADIEAHPQEYKEAGEWLDHFYDQDRYWEKTRDALETYLWLQKDPPKDVDKQRHLSQYIELLRSSIDLKCPLPLPRGIIGNWERYCDYEHCKAILEDCRRRTEDEVAEVSKEDLFLEAVNEIECSQAYSFGLLEIEEARRICLLTWLLTDQEAENSNIHLTAFQPWPWSGPGIEDHRRHCLITYFGNSGDRIRWMAMVRRAWARIEVSNTTSKKQKRESDKGEQRGLLEPKPPEFLQKLLWICKHGKKHWKLILLAIIIIVIFKLYALIRNL